MICVEFLKNGKIFCTLPCMCSNVMALSWFKYQSYVSSILRTQSIRPFGVAIGVAIAIGVYYKKTKLIVFPIPIPSRNSMYKMEQRIDFSSCDILITLLRTLTSAQKLVRRFLSDQSYISK